jgi:tetratricopeptide (TPR) repeat protein
MAAEGEFALVRQHLEVSLHSSSWWVSDLDIYALLLDMAVLQRDGAGIQQYAPQAEELAMRYNHRLYQANAHRARGVAHRLAGEFAAAERRLNQALELFNTLETHWQIGRTLFELGEVATAQTNTSQARDYFTRALAAFELMRAAPDATRTQAALDRLNTVEIS